METINSRCDRCGKLMAVGLDLLGRPVRCPHCREIVSAPPDPTSETVASEEALFVPHPPTDEDSIFTPLDQTTDSVFGAADPTEIYSDAPLPPSLDPPTEPIADSTADPPPPGEAAEPVLELTATAPETAPAEALPSAQGRVKAESWQTYAAIILLPYAIVATAAAVYFYYQAHKVPQGFEALPDVEGEHTGAARHKPQSYAFERVIADAPLPAKLWTRLGRPIQVGDVEILPTVVEQRKIVYCYEGSGRQQAESANQALVLTLHLTNTSKDDTFAPTDPAFVKLWDPTHNPRPPKPYTYLQIGNDKFFGGACRWQPLGRRDGEPLEYVQGQDFRDSLEPGQAMTSVVCTNPEDTKVLPALERAGGPLRWRIEVRRGLIRAGNRDRSACAVIGVVFDSSEITRK